jgi:uncharacterized protein (DUF1778 family)
LNEVAKKGHQLQIRVTAAQKAALRRQASQAGQDMSTYVLARVLPAVETRVAELLAGLARPEESRFALAGLNDLLSGLEPEAFVEAVRHLAPRGLTPFLQNYVAAMVEHASNLKGAPPPAWARDVEPLDAPYFAVPFAGLRPYLLRSAPVAFKRRNLFVDATVGDRV